MPKLAEQPATLDLRIRLSDGFEFDSPCWKDRPMRELLWTIQEIWDEVDAVEIVRFNG